MAELGTKFPALGGADRLRLVERAWGQGYRWWVKAARALQAQAIAAHEQRQQNEQRQQKAAAAVVTDYGSASLASQSDQEQDDRAPTHRQVPKRMVSPVIKVKATGEFAVAGIHSDPGDGQARAGRRHAGASHYQKHRRRQQQPLTQGGPAGNITCDLQNVHGDRATVAQLRHVSDVAVSVHRLVLTPRFRCCCRSYTVHRSHSLRLSS